jgi:hypothetical protein
MARWRPASSRSCMAIASLIAQTRQPLRLRRLKYSLSVLLNLRQNLRSRDVSKKYLQALLPSRTRTRWTPPC